MKSNAIIFSVFLIFVLMIQSANSQNIRINEVGTTVEFEGTTTWVELHNFGDSEVDVNEMWLCTFPNYSQIGFLDVLAGNSSIPPGGYLVVEWNVFGTTEGELGLYQEGAGGSDDFDFFANPDNMIDYMQYGSDVGGRDDEAEAAGIWTDGTFVETVEMSQSYSFFELNADDPVDNWKPGEPTPGAENEEAVATSIEEDEGTIASEFELMGNFPNPFNPTTTIQFNLPSAATVQIDVYNVIGQKLMTVDAGSFSAGQNRQFSLDASDLSSGTYLYRVTADSRGEILTSNGSFTLIK